MVISEIITLIGLLRGLFQRKAEISREYFEDFIEPIWVSYVKVHENYKVSFNEYTKIVSSKDFDTSFLIDKIRRDSIYSEDMRAELEALIETILHATGKKSYMELEYLTRVEPSQLNGKSGKLLAFLLSITTYFGAQSTLNAVEGSDAEHNQLVELSCKARLVNRQRYSAIIYLSKQFNEPDVHQILEMFDDLMQNLQTRFQRTSKLYYAVKQDYLK